MVKLEYRGEVIGHYESQKEALKVIKARETVYKYARVLTISETQKQVDFGGYHRYYYLTEVENEC